MIGVDDEASLSRAERNVFQELTSDQKLAYMTVRNANECAAQRLRRVGILPDEALRAINNGVCKIELRNRGYTV